ncbi:MAG: glycosyltransferase [Candidatus Aphodocola sp.]
MKVLLVTRGYPQKHNKNLGLFERDQAIALKKAGHDVAYAVVDIRSIRRKRKFGFNYYIDENGIKVFEMNWPIGPVPRKLIEFFRQEALIKLYDYILKIYGRPDIVHAHFLNYGVISVKLCKKEKLPLVITEHSSYLLQDTHSRSVRKRAKKTYQACSAIIAVSKPLAEKIKELSGCDAKVISNIASINIPSNSSPQKSKNKFVFASAANLLKGKGFDILIKGFAHLAKTEKNVELWIYGDGPERKKLTQLANDLKVIDNIHFYGKYEKDEIYDLFSRADCFVLTSRRETFGVVYIEAMACGIPVIATRCGGPEHFVNDDNGYLIPVDDDIALCKAMKQVIKDIHKFDSKKIKQFVSNNFSEKEIADKITEVYDRIMDD